MGLLKTHALPASWSASGSESDRRRDATKPAAVGQNRISRAHSETTRAEEDGEPFRGGSEEELEDGGAEGRLAAAARGRGGSERRRVEKAALEENFVARMRERVAGDAERLVRRTLELAKQVRERLVAVQVQEGRSPSKTPLAGSSMRPHTPDSEGDKSVTRTADIRGADVDAASASGGETVVRDLSSDLEELTAFAAAARSLVSVALRADSTDSVAAKKLSGLLEALEEQLEEVDDLHQHYELTMTRRQRAARVEINKTPSPTRAKGGATSRLLSTPVSPVTSSPQRLLQSSPLAAAISPVMMNPGADGGGHKPKRRSFKKALERGDRDELMRSGYARRFAAFTGDDSLLSSDGEDFGEFDSPFASPPRTETDTSTHERGEVDEAGRASLDPAPNAPTSSRQELLGGARRNRKKNTEQRAADAVKMHRAEQESLTAEMADLAASMKANSQSMSSVVQRDLRQLTELESQVEDNKARIDAENARLAEQVKQARAWTWKLWGLLFTTVVMFMATYLFIKITRFTRPD